MLAKRKVEHHPIDTPAPDCFISYSSRDSRIAVLLWKRLTQKGISAFLAQESLSPGDEWADSIRAIVPRCQVVLLLHSRRSRGSVWVQQEAGMALASGSILIPISLDKGLRLPGWLVGKQAIRFDSRKDLKRSLDFVVECVSRRIGAAWEALPRQLRYPKTVGSTVLRAVILDQFASPKVRIGAWSRQYDRYLRLYYGDNAVRRTTAQGASLTFTAMVVERLSRFTSSSQDVNSEVAKQALRSAASFVLGSQHKEQGGFGRRIAELGTRGWYKLHLDMRHTCWAIRALLSMDAQEFYPQIKRGLEWLSWHIRHRDSDDDRWCWTTAPVISLMGDPRLRRFKHWQRQCRLLRVAVQIDLEQSFDYEIGSWVKGERDVDKRTWVTVDNALYVLYCLKNCRNLSSELKKQRRIAIKKLLDRCQVVDGDVRIRGLPMFKPNEPDVGPTAQLIEIIDRKKFRPKYDQLAKFVEKRLRSGQIMPSTFSWHLSALLTMKELRDRPLRALRA